MFDFFRFSLIGQMQEIRPFAIEMPIHMRHSEGLETWIHFHYLVM